MRSCSDRTKRALDIVIAFLALLISSPILVMLATIICMTLGTPVLFRQMRPGFKNKNFELLKLRTMADLRDSNGRELTDHLRLTRIGRVIRRLSLDELPELWNVIRGEMSLVGPRPLLMEYLDYYSPEQARRHHVKPGITGWAQVNGRNAISWEDKFKYDIWYVDNRTNTLDLKILWMTAIQVLKRQNINQPGQATMQRFRGSGGLDGR